MISVNGHQLHVETYGSRKDPAFFLLHHGLGSVRAWRNTIPALIEAGYYVIAYDRWGFGASSPRNEFSIPYFNEDVADLHDLYSHLEVEKAALIGHSDGGTIALYYAAKFPDQVQALVSVAAHIYVEPQMESGLDHTRRAFEQDSRFREGMTRIHGDRADAVFVNWYEGWRKQENLNWDIRPVLRRIECPTLVVQGMEDEYASDQHAWDIAGAIPNADLWLAPEGVHMLPQNMPDEFNQRVIAFLGEHVKRQ